MADNLEPPGDDDWAFLRYGAFHLPIPGWAGPDPNREISPFVKHILELLDHEIGVFGQDAWRVKFSEGSEVQRIWTAVALAHHELYYSGIHEASTDYVNYHTALRLWIQRDIICYSLDIPRVYTNFPYPPPPIAGDNWDGDLAYACMRIRAPQAPVQQLGRFFALSAELVLFREVEALQGQLQASQRATQVVRSQLDASRREVQVLQNRLESFRRVRTQHRNFRRNLRGGNFRQRGRRPNSEVDAPDGEIDAPGSEVEATQDQGEHPEV
ncbi:hypothetical protein F5X98DRAFT_384501 [Xylaria grammica]|nr:hypothetical protein F5X98DRAFT_384501 [Xylaria grammica]